MNRRLVILNPVAGRGRVRREWPRMADRLHAAGVAFEVAETKVPGEAERLAERAARDYDAVIGAGGTRFFANGMDIGFGAHASRNVRRVPAFLTGRGAYLGALALTLLRYPKPEVRLQLDGGESFAQTTAMTAVMNGRAFGGSFHVCPEARIDDGELDLLIADGVGRLEILGLVPKIMRGAHGGDPRLKLTRAKRVVIESEAPLLVEADGEIAFEDVRRLEVAILPGALRVLA